MPPVSVPVVQGQTAQNTDYNNLRTDVLDNSTQTGHGHTGGTDGKTLPKPNDEYLSVVYLTNEGV